MRKSLVSQAHATKSVNQMLTICDRSPQVLQLDALARGQTKLRRWIALASPARTTSHSVDIPQSLPAQVTHDPQQNDRADRGGDELGEQAERREAEQPKHKPA